MIDIFRQRRNTKLSQKVVSNLVELIFMSKHTLNTSDVFKEEKRNQPRVSDIGLASLTKCLNTSLM